MCQFLRLAQQSKADAHRPYRSLYLPDETKVGSLKEIYANPHAVCLILLKEGQIFTRNITRLQEIALDTLQMKYIESKERLLKEELLE